MKICPGMWTKWPNFPSQGPSVNVIATPDPSAIFGLCSFAALHRQQGVTGCMCFVAETRFVHVALTLRTQLCNNSPSPAFGWGKEFDKIFKRVSHPRAGEGKPMQC